MKLTDWEALPAHDKSLLDVATVVAFGMFLESDAARSRDAQTFAVSEPWLYDFALGGPVNVAVFTVPA